MPAQTVVLGVPCLVITGRIVYHPRMRIGVAQTQPAFGEVERNLAEAVTLASKSADLWVFPEFFSTGYQFLSREEAMSWAEPVPEGPTTEAFESFCRDRACYAVGGLPERDGDRVYNAAILVGPDGLISCYRKIHLFGDEKLYFEPGNRPFSVVDIGPARVGVMICFDHLFPEAARTLALLGADVIAHPANLILPDLAQRTMRVRALENGVYAATANRVGSEARGPEALRYTGQSQVIAPDGQILGRCSSDRPESLVVEVDVARARSKRITSRNDKLADRRPEMYRMP